MTRDIDEAYWQDYYRTHNERRFDDLVARFFTEDAAFANPKVEVTGREPIVGFFKQSTQDVTIDLIPTSIVSKPGVTAVELDCVVRAQKDLPDFLLGPLKKEAKASIPMAAVYHLAGDRIFRARVYWGRCPA